MCQAREEVGAMMIMIVATMTVGMAEMAGMAGMAGHGMAWQGDGDDGPAALVRRWQGDVWHVPAA